MKVWLVLVVALAWLTPARGQEAYKEAAGPYGAVHRDEVWKDEKRAREVPVRIYTPHLPAEKAEAGRGKPGKFPVIVYSHGLGGSRNVGAYLADHLATHGYIVISPTHPGSDTEAVREAAKRMKDSERGTALRKRVQMSREGMEYLKESTSDPENLKNRPRDVSFVLDHVAVDEKLAPIADLEHVGVMGHSFGAYTGFAIAGMTIDLPEGEDGGAKKSFRDPRVKAVVAMSPQGAGAMGITRSSWDAVAAPVLSLTGTKDYGQGERAAAWRREGFDAMKDVDAMLVVIRGATHGTFSDLAGSRLRGEESSKDHPKHIKYVKMVTTAYFDAYVLGNKSAEAWLGSGELGKFDEGACAVEMKRGAGGNQEEKK